MPDPRTLDAFDVYTVVILSRPDDAPELSDEELGTLKRRHLDYRAELKDQGLTAASGPFLSPGEESHRGLSIFACDPTEAARLSAADPYVVAGWLSYDVMEWRTSAESLTFPLNERPVGDRRSLPR